MAGMGSDSRAGGDLDRNRTFTSSQYVPELRRSEGFVTHTIKSGETAASRCSPAALATGVCTNQKPNLRHRAY